MKDEREEEEKNFMNHSLNDTFSYLIISQLVIIIIVSNNRRSQYSNY